MTHDFFCLVLQKVPEMSQKVIKMLINSLKVFKSAEKWDFIVLVLLSAHAKRVSVYRLRDYFTPELHPGVVFTPDLPPRRQASILPSD